MNKPYLLGVKMVQLAKRRKDLTHEQFKSYWLTEHNRKIEQRLVNMGRRRKIVASFAEGILSPEGLVPGREPPFDGMLEMFYENDTLEDIKATFGDPEFPPFLAELYEDEENFVDPEPRDSILIEHYVMAERKQGKR